ncbi:single-pass membrane and coiled-coil domain-containing protein 1 [Bombina bombina]|uniref:single-pass membrane and coiled-coil domain-containing protein 1 n=1 Tax=Bombina bombina TaxID=8345 RepID=UPI00235A5A5D|nr:single-pass membrane and coiled-coil domain-containing protein 1 [Bombina bombina]
MSKKRLPYSSFKPALFRLEQRLDVVDIQFDNLQKRADKLTHQLDGQGESLVRQNGEDDMWMSLLEDSFSTYDRNLIYSYVFDALRLLHSQVKEQLPDQMNELPTLAAVLKLKVKRHKIRRAFNEGLKSLALSEEQLNSLCIFFITYCQEAGYLPPEERHTCANDVTDMVGHVVKNQLLKLSLQNAVLAIENYKVKKMGSEV